MVSQIVCPSCHRKISGKAIIDEAAKGEGSYTQFLVCECGGRITYWQITAQLREQRTIRAKILNWFRRLSRDWRMWNEHSACLAEFPDTFWSFKHALRFVRRKAGTPPLGLLPLQPCCRPNGINACSISTSRISNLGSLILWGTRNKLSLKYYRSQRLIPLAITFVNYGFHFQKVIELCVDWSRSYPTYKEFAWNKIKSRSNATRKLLL